MLCLHNCTSSKWRCVLGPSHTFVELGLALVGFLLRNTCTCAELYLSMAAGVSLSTKCVCVLFEAGQGCFVAALKMHDTCPV